MFPGSLAYYVLYRIGVDPEERAYLFSAKSSVAEFPYFFDNLLCQYGFSVGLSASYSVIAALLVAVFIVVGLCSYKKVAPSLAGGVVAMMQNIKSFRNGLNLEFIGISVCQNVHVVDVKSSVGAAVEFCSGPFPAMCFHVGFARSVFVDTLPERGLSCFVVYRHGNECTTIPTLGQETLHASLNEDLKKAAEAFEILE